MRKHVTNEESFSLVKTKVGSDYDNADFVSELTSILYFTDIKLQEMDGNNILCNVIVFDKVKIMFM